MGVSGCVRRRPFLATGTVVALGLAGCLDGFGGTGGSDPDDGDSDETETGSEDDDESGREQVYITARVVQEDEIDPGTAEVCDYEELSPEKQEDVRRATAESGSVKREATWDDGCDYVLYDEVYYRITFAE